VAPILLPVLLRKRSDPDALRVGDRVVAVQPVGAIPVGTRGRIKLVDGFGWTRYWVAWETGEWIGSVDAHAVVAVDRLAQYHADRAAAETRAALVTAGGGDAPAAVADGGPGDGGGGRVPEHLLERARQARERKAAQAAG